MNPALALANRTLERERWARDKLVAHAGRTFRIRIGPASALLAVTAGGTLESGVASPDLTLTIPFLRAPELLARPERFAELAEIEGDQALARTLADLAITMPWFIEQALSSALGPIVGMRLADAGRALLAFPGHAAQSFGASLGGYLRDETRSVLGKPSVDAFASDVSAIAQRVHALESRIDALEPNDATQSTDR